MAHEKTETDSVSDSLESLETKSSMSGSADSMLTKPKPFSVILLVTLSMLLIASVGGLSTSAIDFRDPSQTPTRPPAGVTQSFIMFSSLISPLYILLHLFVALRNFEVIRRQPLQSPVVSWTVIVARISLLLWLITVILASVTVSHKDSNTMVTRSNLAIAVFGILCLSILVTTIEIAAEPFELPFTPRKATVTCLISSFEEDLKRRDVRHYRTMTMDSTSSRGTSRSNSISSKKNYTQSSTSPPSSPPRTQAQAQSRPAPCKRCTTIVEEEEGPPTPLTIPSPCQPPPPGTAWVQDWEALAVDTGVRRNGSVSDCGSSVASEEAPARPRLSTLRRPPPAIIVTKNG